MSRPKIPPPPPPPLSVRNDELVLVCHHIRQCSTVELYALFVTSLVSRDNAQMLCAQFLADLQGGANP